MDAISSFLDLLKVHGPWAVVALEAVVIWKLAIYIQTMEQRHQATVKELLLDHNKEQKEETTQLVTAMISTEKALSSIHDTITAALTRDRT